MATLERDTREIVQALMREAGVDNAADFARASGKSPAQLSRWLGGSPARLSTLREVAEAIGVDPAKYGLIPPPRLLRAGDEHQPEWALRLEQQNQQILERLEQVYSALKQRAR